MVYCHSFHAPLSPQDYDLGLTNLAEHLLMYFFRCLEAFPETSASQMGSRGSSTMDLPRPPRYPKQWTTNPLSWDQFHYFGKVHTFWRTLEVQLGLKNILVVGTE